MINKILLATTLLLVTACDNIDISRYPESVQKCYNEIIYDDNNCTHSKRTIVKYCECTTGQEGKINAKAEELNQGLRSANAFVSTMKGPMGNLFAAGMWNSAQTQLNEYAQKLYDECAKKTGYTRVKNCKKPKEKK